MCILYRPKAETMEVTPSGTQRYHCTIRSCEIIVVSMFFFISVGITEKLDHLKDLGVGTVWLSPIYKSPMVDNGYDISDFCDIDPSFGTLDDFDKLKARAKDLGQYDIPPTKAMAYLISLLSHANKEIVFPSLDRDYLPSVDNC
jgi:hypothetical protein